MKRSKLKYETENNYRNFLGIGYVHARTLYICTEDIPSLPSCPSPPLPPRLPPPSPSRNYFPRSTDTTSKTPSMPSSDHAASAGNPAEASVCGWQTPLASSCCAAGDSLPCESGILWAEPTDMLVRNIGWCVSSWQSGTRVRVWAWAWMSPSSKSRTSRSTRESRMNPPRAGINQRYHHPWAAGSSRNIRPFPPRPRRRANACGPIRIPRT